jgi:hypothetical protein
MSRDHDVLGTDRADFGLYLYAVFLQSRKDMLVMDQFAKNSERLMFGFVKGQIDGVADAETHAQMLCP